MAALFLGNGYYVRRPFYDSRMLDGEFMHDKFRNGDELAALWRRAGITHVFVNGDYIDRAVPSDPARWPLEYRIFLDPGFSGRCLTKVFASKRQSLWAFTCRQDPPALGPAPATP